MSLGNKLAADAVKLFSRMSREDKVYSFAELYDVAEGLYSKTGLRSFIIRAIENGYFTAPKRGHYELTDKAHREVISMEKELEL